MRKWHPVIESHVCIQLLRPTGEHVEVQRRWKHLSVWLPRQHFLLRKRNIFLKQVEEGGLTASEARVYSKREPIGGVGGLWRGGTPSKRLSEVHYFWHAEFRRTIFNFK